MSALLALLLASTPAYETFLRSGRTYPNSDRVQRILTDDWLATGGRARRCPVAEGTTHRSPVFGAAGTQ